MKLNETIQIEQPLFESFQDLKRIIRDTFIEVVGSDSLGSHSIQDFAGNYRVTYTAYKNLMRTHEDLLKVIRDKTGFPTRKEMTTPEGLLKSIRYIVKHPVTSNYPHLKDTGHWIKMLRSKSGRIHFSFAYFLDAIEDAYFEIIDFEKNPERQKPEITTIKKTSKYHIYKPENYMGARKICNTFGTTWCVGADPNHFDAYGSSSGREMYVVSLPNKKVISFHIGSTFDYLITDHSNKNEVTNAGSRGSGMEAIVNDMKAAGLTEEDAVNVFQDVMGEVGIPRDLIDKVRNAYKGGQEGDIYQSSTGSVSSIKFFGRKAGVTFYVIGETPVSMMPAPPQTGEDSDMGDMVAMYFNENPSSVVTVDPISAISEIQDRGFSSNEIRKILGNMYREMGSIRILAETLTNGL